MLAHNADRQYAANQGNMLCDGNAKTLGFRERQLKR